MAKNKTPIEINVEALQEEVGKIKETVNRIKTNWDKDRNDFQEFNSKFAHWETQMKIMEKTVAGLPQATRDRVTDAIEPAKQAAEDLQEVIKDKKIIAVDNLETKKQLKKHWYFLWLK